MPLSTDQQLLTLGEVAATLRVSKAHVSKLVNGRVRGTPPLPAARLGRRVIVRKDSLDKWLLALDTERRLG
jgi:excisionase family DNA binding protein